MNDCSTTSTYAVPEDTVFVARVPAALDRAAAPFYLIRGHQLGYRARANSYDGWDKKQYEQYIRELVIFGANSIGLDRRGFDKEADWRVDSSAAARTAFARGVAGYLGG